MPNTPKSNDLLPEGTIRFMDAFDWYLDEAFKNPHVVSRHPFQDILERAKQRALQLSSTQDDPQAARRLESNFRLKEFEVFFRLCLSEGELKAYVRDPVDGAHLQLDSGEWLPYPLLLALGDLMTFNSDFLDDRPTAGNPSTIVREARRPVFFYKKEFEAWLKVTFNQEKHAGGRPPGSGSWAAADEELITRMHKLIEEKKAKSAHYAAGIVADDAAGGGTVESKQRRLARAYLKKFPRLERN